MKGKIPGFKSMIWNIRKKKTVNQNRCRNKNSKKKKERIRSPWDISKSANIRIQGVPEGEEEDQNIENLFEKITKENFPNLAKEIDIQVQEAQRVLNKLCHRGPRQDT